MAQQQLFAVFQQGVYRHFCGGIFTTKEGAVNCANALAAADRDSYHDYEVVPFEPDRRYCLGEKEFEPDAVYKVAKPKE